MERILTKGMVGQVTEQFEWVRRVEKNTKLAKGQLCLFFLRYSASFPALSGTKLKLFIRDPGTDFL